MKILSILITSVLILAGLYYLIKLFFMQDSSVAKKEKGNKDGIQEVQTLIQKMEKENPEQVAKIREQFMAEVQIKNAKESEPEDVGGVVKQWMSDTGKGD